MGPSFGLRVPNKTPTGPREGRRASVARNASRSVAGTTRDERDAASRRPPPLARRDEARQAPRGVSALEQRTTLSCGPFLAVHPAWLHRGLVGVWLGTLWTCVRRVYQGRRSRSLPVGHIGYQWSAALTDSTQTASQEPSPVSVRVRLLT